jgi:hypothetical protein
MGIDKLACSFSFLFVSLKNIAVMATNILRRSLTTATSSKALKIGLLPADGIGREGEG